MIKAILIGAGFFALCLALAAILSMLTNKGEDDFWKNVKK